MLLFEKISGKFRPRKVGFLEAARPGSRRTKYNVIWSTFRKTRLTRSKNVEESKTLNEIAMKPRTKLNLQKSLLTCCAASEVCKQSCPRPLKSLKYQGTLSPELLKKFKERRYSYCVISRYFALRHLRRHLSQKFTFAPQLACKRGRK